MPPDPRAIHISTDGSCYKNPGGRSGCAAIIHYPDHLDREDEQIVDFGCEESSNNRMELLACIRVLNGFAKVVRGKALRECRSSPIPNMLRTT
jgi:ribonuclease HI